MRKPLAVLSGPSHAEEVSRGMPTSLVAASADFDLASLKAAIQHDVHLLGKILDCVKPITPAALGGSRST